MNFNSTDFTTLLRVLDVRGRNITPPYSLINIELPRAENSVIAYKKNDTRIIQVDFLVSGTNLTAIRSDIRTNIAPLLYPADNTYKALVFSDETDKKWYAIPNTGIEIYEETNKTVKATISFLCKLYAVSTTQTTVNSAAPLTSIEGTNAGTYKALGVINFVIASTPDTFNISLDGTTGNVSLSPPSGEDLDGTWILDLDARTVKKDGALAMNYLDIANTVFDTFEIPVGDYTITFDSAVASGSYVYNARYI